MYFLNMFLNNLSVSLNRVVSSSIIWLNPSNGVRTLSIDSLQGVGPDYGVISFNLKFN